MNSQPSVRRVARCLLPLALLAFASVAVAQTAGGVDPQRVTLSLDRDLITFTTWAVSLGGLFLLVFAGIGVLFFGWDVTKTRNALFDARNDIAARLVEIHRDHAALKKLKEDLEQLGGELEGEIAKKDPPPGRPPATENESADESDEPGHTPVDKDETVLSRRLAIRKALKQSKFKWTTIGTIQKKTGLGRDAIVEAVTNDGGIVISTGANTRDLIFKLTEDYLKEQATLTAEQLNKILEEHAATGKQPVANIFGQG